MLGLSSTRVPRRFYSIASAPSRLVIFEEEIVLQILPIPDNDPFEVLVGVVPLPSEGLLIDDVIVDGFVRELAQVDDPLPALAAEMSAAPNPSRGEVQFSISGVTGAARNNVAHVVSAGVYSYELSTPGAHATKRRIVIR